MADHQVPSQQGAHQPHGYVQHNPHRDVGGDQQDVHREGVPQPLANAVMQGEMQYPPRIEVPNYNMAHYRPPPPNLEVPYVHMHRGVGVAEAIPAQAHPLAPDVQGNYYNGPFGYGAQLPAADHPEAFPGVWPHPALPANIPPANGLRNLAGHYLNNPNAHVYMLRIEPGLGGRFEVWIALELADIF